MKNHFTKPLKQVVGRAIMLMLFITSLSACRTNAETEQIETQSEEFTTQYTVKEERETSIETMSSITTVTSAELEVTTAKNSETIISTKLVTDIGKTSETTTTEPVTDLGKTSEITTTEPATDTAKTPHTISCQEELITAVEGEIKPTVFTDKKDKQEYIIISITPVNIYWNEIKNLSLEKNTPVDIFIPAEFGDVVSDADELVLWFTETAVNEEKISIDNINDFNIIRGLKTYNNNIWNVDRMYPVKTDTIVFYDNVELTDIKMLSDRYSDGFMSAPFRYKGENLLFKNGMTTQEADKFFLAIHNDHKEYLEKIQRLWEEDGVETEIEYSDWTTLLGGARFRAEINKIY